MKMNFLNNRRFKHGSLATIITVGFIIAIVLINVVATLLLERFPLTIDLTGDKRFKLTQESIDYVKKIDQKIDIAVCGDEAAYSNSGVEYKQAYEIIKNYAKYSDKISVKFIDLKKDPGFAKKHADQDLIEYDILISSDLRSKKITTDSLFESQRDQSGNTLTSSNAEQTMTAALMYVTDKNPVSVSLLTGIDNVDVTGYKTLLEANNYSVTEQNILTDTIDEKASFVILPQPATDLTAQEVKKLSDFLDNDGKFDKSLVFVAAPNGEIGPVLKNFLADWGIEVGNETVLETDGSHVLDKNGSMMLNQIADDEFGKLLKSQEAPVVSVYARPITTLFTEKDNRKTKVLTKTYDTCVLMPANPPKDFDPTKAKKGEYNTMVLGTRTKYEGTTQQTSNVVAISTATILTTELLNIPSLANNDAIISMTGMLSAKKDTVKILPISLNTETITISQAQVTTFTVLFVIVVPLVIIILGFVIWLRRRHL